MKISEIFYSIQGEGVEIGLPTVFVRLFACDLRCTWCDSMYAVEGKDFREQSIEEVLRVIGKFNCKRIDRKSTRLNSSHMSESRMPSSA